MIRTRNVVAVLLLSCVVQPVATLGRAANAATEEQQTGPEWQKEFDELCSKTQDAMTFSTAELATLIQRCDALEPKIEKLDETRRKIYLKRLRQCRGLYAYVLESKKSEKK